MTRPIVKNYKMKARKLLRFLTTNELLLRQEIKSERNHISFLEKTAASLNSISSSLKNLRKSNIKTYCSSKGSKHCQTLRSISPNSGCLTLQKPQLMAQKIKRATSQTNIFPRMKNNYRSQKRKRVKSRKERRITSQSNFLFKSPEPRILQKTNKKSFKFLLSKLKNIGKMGTIKASKETTSRKIESLSKEIKQAKDRSEVRRKICKRIDVLVSRFDNYDENSYSYFKDTNDYIETDSIVKKIQESGQKKRISKLDSVRYNDNGEAEEEGSVENRLKGVLSFSNLQDLDGKFGEDGNFSEVRNGLSSFFKESRLMKTSPRNDFVVNMKKNSDRASRLSLDLNASNQFEYKPNRVKAKMKSRKGKVGKERIKEFKNLEFFRKEPKGKGKRRSQRRVPGLKLRNFRSSEFKFHSFMRDGRGRNNRLNLVDVLSNPEVKKKSETLDQSRVVEQNLEKRKLLIDKISNQLAEIQGNGNIGYSFT